MMIDACGATHKGNFRKDNEDNIYVDAMFRNDLSKSNILIRGQRAEGPSTYAVFDGLGGEACGERASYLSAALLKGMEERGLEKDAGAFVSLAHKAIRKDAAKKSTRGMGTTAVIVQIDGNMAHVSNVGDSRAYLFRDGRLQQLSKDHSVFQSMIDYGFTDAAERNRNQYASELTQYIGMYSEEDIEPSIFETETELRQGDILLLCSDGLTDELSDEEIGDILEEYRESGAERLTGKLIKDALDARGSDNISAVVVCVI